MRSWLWWALISLTPAGVPLCHTLPLSGSYLPPSDPRHLYPFLSTASHPLGNKQNNRPDLAESLLTVERSFPSGMTGNSFSLFSLYKSDWYREKCIDFEGWLHHRCCVQRGKKHINTFHIPLWWSAIDQEPCRFTISMACGGKICYLLTERHSTCLTSLLLPPSTAINLLCSRSGLSSAVFLSCLLENWWIRKWLHSQNKRLKRSYQNQSDGDGGILWSECVATRQGDP